MSSHHDYYSLFTVRSDDLDFHLRSIMEILNNRGDIEISPLCDQTGQLSPLIGPLMKALQDNNFGIEISQLDEDSPSEGQNPGAVLKAWVQECALA